MSKTLMKKVVSDSLKHLAINKKEKYMSISKNILQDTLQSHLPDAQISCKDLAGDDNHWEVTVLDASFKEKTRIQQHRIVHKALADHKIHSLSIKTETL